MYQQPNNGDYIVRLVKQYGVMVAICMIALFVAFESLTGHITPPFQTTPVTPQAPLPTAPPAPAPTATPPPPPTQIPTAIPQTTVATSTNTENAPLSMMSADWFVIIVVLTLGVAALFVFRPAALSKAHASSAQSTQLHSTQQILGHVDYNHGKLERQLRTLHANDQAHGSWLRTLARNQDAMLKQQAEVIKQQTETIKQQAVIIKRLESLERESRIIYQPIPSMRNANRQAANGTNGMHKNGTGPRQPDFDPFEEAGK